MHYGSGSILSSRTGFVSSAGGSARPSRPGQLSGAILDGLAGGADPEVIRELSHTSAAALLDRVHHTEDPSVVERVLTLVDREGVDVIAELWSHCEADSLPGVLWRLYLLRTWMRRHRETIARLWRIGEPVATTASAIAGVDQAPTEEDIARTADSILAGAFTGDFAVALERAAAFVDVVANGLRVEARHMTRGYRRDAVADGVGGAGAADDTAAAGSVAGGAPGDAAGALADATGHASDGPLDGGAPEPRTENGAGPVDADERARRTKAARLMHTAGNLLATARDFRHGAALWRHGRLE